MLAVKHSVNDYCAQIMKDNAVDLNNCAIEEDENEEGASVFHYESQPNDKNLQHELTKYAPLQNKMMNSTGTPTT